MPLSFGAVLPTALPGVEFSLWLSPKYLGAPGRIRIPNPQIRSLVLYPIELRAPDSRM